MGYWMDLGDMNLEDQWGIPEFGSKIAQHAWTYQIHLALRCHLPSALLEHQIPLDYVLLKEPRPLYWNTRLVNQSGKIPYLQILSPPLSEASVMRYIPPPP
jgi:hypothetical protein